MAAEVQSILREALVPTKPESLADIALRLFGPENGFEMPEIPRSEAKGAVFDDDKYLRLLEPSSNELKFVLKFCQNKTTEPKPSPTALPAASKF